MTAAFIVFGCRLNQAEAAEWQSRLTAFGAEWAPEGEADVLFVHTCAVTATAAHEAEKRLKALRKRRPDAKILVSGCAAGLLPEGLVDRLVPHEQKARWLDEALALLDLRPDTPQRKAPATTRARASLIVQDGCDRFCAYCIVPHTRGAPVSQPLSALLAKAERLFAEGFREIVLTGCHLALYRDPDSGAGLPELLRRLCAVRGEGRFRLSSLEPCVLDDKALVRQIAESGGRLCPFLHLPIQTASDPLLDRMGRRYTQRQVRNLLETIAATLPLCGLSADWIVGLPGETEADAQETRALVADFPFTDAHLFPYSRRPGTPAAGFSGQVPPAVVQARLHALRETLAKTQHRVLPRFIGKQLTVIPEKRRDDGWEGWSAQRIRCLLPLDARRRELTPFTPTRLEAGLFR